MLQLYGNTRSRAMRCLWMLEEVGQPYQLVETSTRANDVQSAEYLRLNPNARIPAEILEWLGTEYYNQKNYAAAEKYLGVLGKIDSPSVKPDFWFYLGDAAARQQKYDEAEDAFGKYLQVANDPAGKAKVLLKLGDVKIAAHKPDDAQKIAEQIMVRRIR